MRQYKITIEDLKTSKQRFFLVFADTESESKKSLTSYLKMLNDKGNYKIISITDIGEV